MRAGIRNAIATGSLSLLLAAPALAGDRAFLPRAELPKHAQLAVPPYAHRLVVKFRDPLRARALADGSVRSLAGGSLAPINGLAAQHGATFRQLASLPDATLESLQDRAAAASGAAQPDLAAMMEVSVPGAAEQAVADALNASPLTEWVDFEQLTPPPPNCVDAYPPTPSYLDLQGYRRADPGVNMDAAWALGDTRGAGIRIADCEYGVWTNHEDLCDVTREAGQSQLYYPEHGTATLGEIGAGDNGYGCRGLAPDAVKSFFCEYSVQEGSRRTTCILAAISSVGPGDVVMLEMQTSGPGGDYCPAEYDMSVWTAVKTGTDANVIITAAAGNGAQDLDSAPFESYRARGDSGAIIVGAGSASAAHSPLFYSTYGARVNVQGWGEKVTTLGYGDLASLGSYATQDYTAQFNGTSSATPIVTGCVLALQSRAVATIGHRLTPHEMRQLLIDTGIPQGTGGHIGPFPDAYAAALTLQPSVCKPDCNKDGKLNINDFICMQAKWRAREPYGDYDASGTYTINDFIRFQADFAKGCK